MTEQPQTIRLTLPLRGQDATIQAKITSTEASPYTGRALGNAESRITVDEAAVDELKETLESVAATDPNGAEWRGRVGSESYVDGAPGHHVSIEWTQSERAIAERVEFHGLELVPDHYEEEADENGNVLITLNATLAGEEIEHFRALARRPADEERYWPVVRVGVSDQPRSMRLGGRLLWSKQDDGSIRQRITLVDASMDDNPADRSTGLLSLTEPQQPRIMAQLADTSARLDRLVEILANKGMLDDADAGLVVEAGADARRSNMFRFFEVEDLEDWD